MQGQNEYQNRYAFTSVQRSRTIPNKTVHVVHGDAHLRAPH